MTSPHKIVLKSGLSAAMSDECYYRLARGRWSSGLAYRFLLVSLACTALSSRRGFYSPTKEM